MQEFQTAGAKVPHSCPRYRPRTTEVRPCRSAALAWAAAVVAAIVLSVGASPAEARRASPFGEIHATLNNLFAPPRRARAARTKRPKQATPAKQATPPAKQAPLPSQSRGAKAEPPPKPEAGAKVEAPRQAAPSARQTQVSERSPNRAVPLPPERPPMASPRRETTAKSTAKETASAKEATTPPKDTNTAPASQADRPPQRERTAALPPPLPGDKSSAGEPEAAPDSAPPEQPPPPSACQLRLPDIAAIQIVPNINNGACTADEVVRLDAVAGKDGRRIAVTPPATLRCPMAESVVHWIRDEVASVAADLGAPLRSVTVDTSFECRSRNRVAGAKLSEHGHANAVDLRAFTLATGVVVKLTDRTVQKEARERLRDAACTRFTTVLGPGSDGYHEDHIHLDLAERRSGYRICQWDVRDPAVVASVPLPPERPASAPPRPAKATKSRSRD
jgi:hypothetical protein